MENKKGTRKRKQKKKTKKQNIGSGITDLITNPIGTLKEAFRSIPSRLSNLSTKTLKEYGDLPIMYLYVIRTPLDGLIMGALNTMSFGKWNQAQKENNIDKMYHLALVAHLDGNKKIIVEKNEVINIEPLKESQIKKNTETMQVDLKNKVVSLDYMLDQTLNRIGASKFYDYDALRGVNCQNFVMENLISINALTPQLKDFIYQDFKEFNKSLNNSSLSSHVPSTLKKITQLGSFVSRLVGTGEKKNKKYNKNPDIVKLLKKLNIDDDFVKFVLNKGLRLI